MVLSKPLARVEYMKYCEKCRVLGLGTRAVNQLTVCVLDEDAGEGSLWRELTIWF